MWFWLSGVPGLRPGLSSFGPLAFANTASLAVEVQSVRLCSHVPRPGSTVVVIGQILPSDQSSPAGCHATPPDPPLDPVAGRCDDGQ